MTILRPKVTPQIDLRSKWISVREQGDRPTCLACATSDAHAVHQRSDALSAEYLFYHGFQQAKGGNPACEGLHFDEIAFALEHNGQPVEAEWPYTLVQADPWMPPKVTQLWRAKIVDSDADPVVVISEHLCNGTPVVLGLELSGAFVAPMSPENTIDPGGPGFGGHAVLAVGLGHSLSGEIYILIRNSWGDGWGENGYAWLHTEYLQDKMIGYGAVSNL